MKYKDYVKKHEKVIMPINYKLPLMNALSTISMLGDEIGGDFSDRIDNFIKKEKDILLNSEVKLE